VVQATLTLATLLPLTVPVPLFTTQVCTGPVGCEAIEMAYAVPDVKEVGNEKDPFAETENGVPALLFS
jgi:hypothetical protein